MINIAILGFGVVGGGVAKLITDNYGECARLGGDDINIKYILDLRDFPDSPFADRVVHDYNLILNDPEVSYVIEVMGGSHPAYEFTMSALRAGKSVISSNKEVVANFGDEFMRAAEEAGVSYRFEAAVGGGIPVLSPMITMLRQNKITEVRGILNGTTNYILTKMFTFGEDFDSCLRDAQAKGYAERNPDADILGIDASRKIAILGALISDKLIPTDKIHTEGITKIRSEDVKAAEKLGLTIKLVGRCIVDRDGKCFIMVSPFMLPTDSPLSGVSGVFNAVEVVGEPIGSVMFYGPGAGAGATASAVVGDLMQAMRSGRSIKMPVMEKSTATLKDFGDFTARNYVAISGDKAIVTEVFGNVSFIAGDEVAFVTEKISEAAIEAALSTLAEKGATIKSRIRLL